MLNLLPVELVGALALAPQATPPPSQPIASPAPRSVHGIELGMPRLLTVGGAPLTAEPPGFASPAWHDVDGDGHSDLIVGQFAEGKLQVFAGSGAGATGLASGTWLESGGDLARVEGIACCTSSTPQFVDLNGDGHVDILSGSYTREGPHMAGLFQVFWGSPEGFGPATVLTDTEGEPLIIDRGGSEHPEVRICTRPSACDLNGDGHLDLVAGNFEGTFHVFWGLEGHAFDPQSTPLLGDKGPLEHGLHSDPFPVDWDGDGDLDLVTGSESGRVSLALNSGSATHPRFTSFETLIAAIPEFAKPTEMVFGHEHITRPRESARVSVADVNGDGVHDLLVGDRGEVAYLLEGWTPEETRRAYAEWRVVLDAINEERPPFDDSEGAEERQAAWQERFNEHFALLDGIVDKRSVGMVFVYFGSLEAEETQERRSSSAP